MVLGGIGRHIWKPSTVNPKLLVECIWELANLSMLTKISREKKRHDNNNFWELTIQLTIQQIVYSKHFAHINHIYPLNNLIKFIQLLFYSFTDKEIETHKIAWSCPWLASKWLNLAYISVLGQVINGGFSPEWIFKFRPKGPEGTGHLKGVGSDRASKRDNCRDAGAGKSTEVWVIGKASTWQEGQEWVRVWYKKRSERQAMARLFGVCGPWKEIGFCSKYNQISSAMRKLIWLTLTEYICWGCVVFWHDEYGKAI